MNITQDILTRFLQEIRREIGLLKDDLKSCIKVVRQEVTEIGSRVDNLEQTVDTRSEDQELMWRRMTTLEQQNIELQSKQEDLENGSRQNNLRIRGILRETEGADIIAFMAALLHSIHGDTGARLSALDHAHMVAPTPRGPNALPNNIVRVHCFTKKESILLVACKSPNQTFQGLNFQLRGTSLPLPFAYEKTLNQSEIIYVAGKSTTNGDPRSPSSLTGRGRNNI
ncbi:hypothetical protein NDU88_005417 [Pleurodeles waltl]|uniref:Uncharacterized protein n=1 Tax=Pleurodeles waltl TaxID=8319 RepID=A0AAV7MAG2_PLEWA|nr:hypothetical protein NDU88_005417 [Pleurodeles waltl]